MTGRGRPRGQQKGTRSSRGGPAPRDQGLPWGPPPPHPMPPPHWQQWPGHQAPPPHMAPTYHPGYLPAQHMSPHQHHMPQQGYRPPPGHPPHLAPVPDNAYPGVNVGPVHPHHAPYTPLSPPSQPSLRHEPSGPPGVDSHSQAPAQAPSQAPQAQDSAANGLTATEPAAKQQATAKQEADPAATQQPDTKAITPEAPSPAPALTEEPKGSAGAAAQADGQQSQGGGTDTAEAAPAADSQLAQSTSTEAGTSSSLSFLKSPKSAPGSGMVLANPGILKNVKKRPGKPKATNSGMTATPPSALTPLTAESEIPAVDLKSQGLPKSTSAAIAAAASAVTLAQPADEVRQPTRRRTSKSRWGAEETAEQAAASTVRGPGSPAPAPGSPAASTVAEKDAGRPQGKRMASEDGEASPTPQPRKSPRRDSRSPSHAARDRHRASRPHESSRHEPSSRERWHHESPRGRRDSQHEDWHTGAPEHRHRRASHHEPSAHPLEPEDRRPSRHRRRSSGYDDAAAAKHHHDGYRDTQDDRDYRRSHDSRNRNDARLRGRDLAALQHPAPDAVHDSFQPRPAATPGSPEQYRASVRDSRARAERHDDRHDSRMREWPARRPDHMARRPEDPRLDDRWQPRDRQQSPGSPPSQLRRRSDGPLYRPHADRSSPWSPPPIRGGPARGRGTQSVSMSRSPSQGREDIRSRHAYLDRVHSENSAAQRSLCPRQALHPHHDFAEQACGPHHNHVAAPKLALQRATETWPSQQHLRISSRTETAQGVLVRYDKPHARAAPQPMHPIVERAKTAQGVSICHDSPNASAAPPFMHHVMERQNFAQGSLPHHNRPHASAAPHIYPPRRSQSSAHLHSRPPRPSRFMPSADQRLPPPPLAHRPSSRSREPSQPGSPRSSGTPDSAQPLSRTASADSGALRVAHSLPHHRSNRRHSRQRSASQEPGQLSPVRAQQPEPAAAPKPGRNLGGGWVAVREPSGSPEGLPIEAPPAPLHPSNQPEVETLGRQSRGRSRSSDPTSPVLMQDPYDPLERHRTPPPAPMHPGYELSPMGPFSPISSPGSPSTQPDDQKASAAKEAMRRRQQAWQQRSRTSDSGQAAQLDSTPLDASQPGPAAAWGHAQSLAEQSYGPPPPPPPPDAPAPPAPHGQHPYGWQQAAVSPMKPSPPWANGGLAPEALLPWQQHAEEREQERQQQQRLAEEMEQVRQHIEAMFLAQLPRCHALILNFPVTGREAMLSWQQRLQARTAQYHWHAPSDRRDGSQPDFSHWDGNPNDPVNFPIAYSARPRQEAEEAAASLELSLQDVSKAPPILPYDPETWTLVEEDDNGNAPEFMLSPSSEDKPADPRPAAQEQLPSVPILLPVPRFAWREPAVLSPEAQEDQKHDGPERSRSWADSPIAEPGPEAVSGAAREGQSRALKRDRPGGSLEEAPPSELADGTSPTELTDSALRNWFDSAYEVAMQASAAEPQSPDAAAGHGNSPPQHSPTGAEAARAAFWQAGAQAAATDAGPPTSAPSQAQLAHAAEAAALPSQKNGATEGQQSAGQTRRQRKRRRIQGSPSSAALANARTYLCEKLADHWQKTHFKKVAAALIDSALGECYGPWRKERERKEQEEARLRKLKEQQEQEERERREREEAAREQERQREREQQRQREQQRERERERRKQEQRRADEAKAAEARAEAQKRAEQSRVREKAARDAHQDAPITQPAATATTAVRPSSAPSARQPPAAPAAEPARPTAHANAAEHQPAQPQQQSLPAPARTSPTASAGGDKGAEPGSSTQQAATPAPPAPSPPLTKRPSTGRGSQRAAAPERLLDDPADDDDEEYAPSGSHKSGLARGNSSVGKAASLKRSGSSISRSASAKKARGGSGSSVSGSGRGRASGTAAEAEGVPGTEQEAPGAGGADDHATASDAEDAEEEQRREDEKHKAMARYYAGDLLTSMVEDLKKFDLKKGHLKKGVFTPEVDGALILGNPGQDGAQARVYSDVVQRPMSLTLISKRVPDTRKSAKQASAPEAYEESLEGLARFKSDLDLLASNCRQFWGPELDYLLSHPEHEEQCGWKIDDLRQFLAHADQFQALVDERFAAGLAQVKRYALAVSRPP